MGRNLAELFAEITDNDLLRRFCIDIASAHTAGTYAVVQGVAFAICGIGKRELFATICYGAASMVLNAALRTMRITHRQTQRIIFELGDEIGVMYNEVAGLNIEQMHSFYPQIDILAAIHEKGIKRLFMN
jgi:urease accessory protein